MAESAEQIAQEPPSSAGARRFFDFWEAGREDCRAGIEPSTDWICVVLAPSRERKLRDAGEEKALAEGLQMYSKGRRDKAEADLQRFRGQEPKSKPKYEKASLLLALIYLATAIVFILSDVALSKQIVSLILRLDNTPVAPGILPDSITERVVFAVALGLIGVVLEIFFYKTFAVPMYRDRQRAGDDAAKVRKWLMWWAVTTLVVVGAFSLMAVGLGGYLRSAVLLPPPPGTQTEQLIPWEQKDELQRADDALKRPEVNESAVEMMILAAIVFAINSGLCLALGLVFFQGCCRNGARWVGYWGYRVGCRMRDMRRRWRLNRENYKMKGVREAVQKASIAFDHIAPIWKADVQSAKEQYLRGYRYEKNLPKPPPSTPSPKPEPQLNYESGRELMLRSN